jgi:DNA-binding beta-propeller fold protein YncE
MRTLLAAAVALVVAPLCSSFHVAAQSQPSGGDGTIYIGSYARSLIVIDESTLEPRAEVPLRSGIPLGMAMNSAQTRFYVTDATFEQIEVVDIQSLESIDLFTLSRGDKKVRIWDFAVAPDDRYMVLLVKTYDKQIDRYDVGPPTLLRYDLQTHAVTDTIPWPEDQERDFMRMIFAPDGGSVYFFSDDLLVLETENFTEVDRWELDHALDAGMGRFSFGFPGTVYEEPGHYTGLFRTTDPIQNRRLMGVARVNLDERDVDFYTLGPSEGVGFALAPDRTRAYGLRQAVGDYQLWTFDLEGRRVASKVNFDGRPRMNLNVSTNGQLLYIANAGNTIDVYDAASFQRLRTVEYEADMSTMVLLPRSIAGN